MPTTTKKKDTKETAEYRRWMAQEEKEARDWEARNPGRRNDPRDEYPVRGTHY